MTDMIERVARAICREEVSTYDTWETYLPLARAAIAAMREPTDAMIEAAYKATVGNAPNRYWQAMIDKALEQK